MAKTIVLDLNQTTTGTEWAALLQRERSNGHITDESMAYFLQQIVVEAAEFGAYVVLDELQPPKQVDEADAAITARRLAADEDEANEAEAEAEADADDADEADEQFCILMRVPTAPLQISRESLEKLTELSLETE